MRRALWFAPLLLSLVCCATIDPWGHRRKLEDAQIGYTRMVRWGDFAKASQWVEPDSRESFFAEVEQLGDLRITDYHIGALEIDDSGDTATARVSYSLYDGVTLIEREVNEVQDWLFTNGKWRVRSQLAGFRQRAAGP